MALAASMAEPQAKQPENEEEYRARQMEQIRKHAHLYPSVQASEPRGLVNDMVAGSLADAEAAAYSDALSVSGTIEQTSVLKYGLEVREFECAPAVETWTTRHIGAACIFLSAYAGEDDVRVRF